MPTVNCDEFLHSAVSVLVGAAGSVASTPVGYVLEEDSVEIRCEVGVEPYRVHGLDLPQRHWSRPKSLVVRAPNVRINAMSLAQALGLSADGNEVSVGDPSQPGRLDQVSVALVGSSLDGATFRLDMPYASSATDLTLALSQVKPSVMRMAFHAEHGVSSPVFAFDGGNTDVALVGGVLTRVAGLHRVSGEGGAADDLTSIAGSVLCDGEIVRLQPASADYAITLKHQADALALFGGADFAMGGSTVALDDYVDLRYDAEAGKWVEVARNDSV
jgi:hypothetical protein